MATRFNAIGLSGRINPLAQTQPAIKTLVVPNINAVASAAAQSTGVFLPAGRTYLVKAYLNVITAEATAVAKTVDVGTTSTADSILPDVDTAAVGLAGVGTVGALDEAEEITYTLAGADFAELEAELVLTIEYNENS